MEKMKRDVRGTEKEPGRKQIQQRLNESLVKQLPLAAMIAGILYGAISILQLASSDRDYGILLQMNPASAILLIAFSVYFYWKPTSAKLVHPIMGFLFIVVLVNTLVRISLGPVPSLGVIFFMIVVSVLINSIGWFVLLIALAMSATTAITWTQDGSSQYWDYIAYNVVGMINAILIFTLRFRGNFGLEKSILLLESQSRELEELNKELINTAKERDKIASTLGESESRYRQLINLAPVSIYVHRNGNILWANPHAREMLGYEHDEDITGHSLTEFMEPAIADEFSRILKIREATRESSLSDNLSLRHVDGHTIKIKASAAPIVFGGEDARIVIAIDVTMQMAYQENLTKAKELAEKASRDKSMFLSSMSHELRTPLNAIMGFCQLLTMDSEQQISAETRRRYLDLIQESGKHLLGLISDLLEIGAVDSRALKLNSKPIMCSILVSESASMVQGAAAQKQLKISISGEDDLFVLGDNIRCRQVLLNLLNNAIRFTPTGSTISVNFSQFTEGFVKFSIKDSGSGVEEDEADKIFNEFYRSATNSSDYANEKSTGIGLAVCKRLIEYHGGKIGVQRAPVGGADFWFTLPACEQNRVGAPDATSQSALRNLPVINMDVLVVEDDAVNLELVRELLSHLNIKILEAKNGKEAIQMARANKPDVILMDIEMPVMNGLDATRSLRQLSEFRNTPIIALTAHADRKSIQLSREAGFTDFISKPIDIIKLMDMLKKYTKDIGDYRMNGLNEA